MPTKRIEVTAEVLDFHLRRHDYRAQPASGEAFQAEQDFIVALQRLPIDATLLRVTPIERRAGYVVVEYEHPSFPRDYYLVGAEVATPSIPAEWDYARQKPEGSGNAAHVAGSDNGGSARASDRASGSYALPDDGGHEPGE